jgi:hypothetical protein
MAAILVLFAVGCADDPVAVDLGGARQAKATVATSIDTFTVQIRFLAVQAFDPATNDRVNREKGREFALLALVKHLTAGKKGTYAVTGATVTAAEASGDRFHLTLQVPRAGVTREDPGAAPAKGRAERVAYTSVLFTRKRDQEQTLASLQAALLAEVENVRTLTERDEALAALNKAESRGLGHLKKLSDDIKSDLLLLGLERDELLGAVGKARQEFTAAVKAAVEDVRRAKD